ncbi:uncharacterized protein LOC130357389 [Hyla sarda]|uniref:uncharacterized protein LOC130357389 n=1 Tax=Hyla sarda TaxID=327740 RepID=UPI0024C41980|nr:uncharacterized protein LOC130357389 [Hyla sarda]
MDFLDVSLGMDEDSFIYSNVYRKITSTNPLLYASSSHLKSLISNIPIGQFLRMRRICSTENFFKEQAKDLECRFQERGYRRVDIQRGYARAKSTPRPTLLTQKKKQNLDAQDNTWKAGLEQTQLPERKPDWSKLSFLQADQMKKAQLMYLTGAIFLVMTPESLQILVRDSSDETRWQEYQAQVFTSNIKRHSEGTFSSDLTRYLDKMKAKDFVQWLMNKKRFSDSKRYIDDDIKPPKLKSDASFFGHNYYMRISQEIVVKLPGVGLEGSPANYSSDEG